MSTWWVLLRLWIIFQTVLVAGVWALSPFRLVDTRGYLLIFAIILAWSAWEIKRSHLNATHAARDLRKLIRRLKRPLPATIGAVWMISLVGGSIWLSTYADSLAYRLPRALHWLADKRWSWIPSDDSRINAVGLNVEMVWMPFLKLLKGDRMLFLSNLLAYTFLPGLFFSFLRGMRIAGRTAWNWMWILPAGYVFAMQAASLGTDAYAAVVALAAIAFAFRARKTKQVHDVWLSALSAGFLTGIKQVGVPFGLVWLPAIIPCLPLLRRRVAGSVLILAIAVIVSFVPLTVANIHYAGAWQGFTKAELHRFEQDSPVWGVVGGAVSVLIHNVVPPIFPWAHRWNDLMGRFTSTTGLGSHFRYDLGFILLQAFVSEHTASLGLGVVGLLILTRLAKRPRRSPHSVDWTIQAIQWTPFIAVLLFLARSSVSSEPRLIAPYYPFFLPVFLAPNGIAAVVRRTWWKRLAITVNLVTVALLLLSFQRPMLPMFTLTEWLSKKNPQSPVAKKIRAAFVTRHLARAESFPRIQASIPPSEKVVGYAVGHQPFLELALWYPLGARYVVRINSADTAETVRAKGIRYVLVDPSVLLKTSLSDWLDRYRGKVVAEFQTTLVYQYDNWISYLVRLDE